jgi:hypothetical protein
VKKLFEILLPAKIDNTFSAGNCPSTFLRCIRCSAQCAASFTCSPRTAAPATLPGWISRWRARMASSLPLRCGAVRSCCLPSSNCWWWSATGRWFHFMWLMLILEVLLRELVGAMKPVIFAHTPPGAIGNQLFLPLAALMLACRCGAPSGKEFPMKSKHCNEAHRPCYRLCSTA